MRETAHLHRHDICTPCMVIIWHSQIYKNIYVNLYRSTSKIYKYAHLSLSWIQSTNQPISKQIQAKTVGRIGARRRARRGRTGERDTRRRRARARARDPRSASSRAPRPDTRAWRGSRAARDSAPSPNRRRCNEELVNSVVAMWWDREARRISNY